jgi:putative transcriptional regulator
MSTQIRFHPDPATLVSYAAGTLAEPLAAVVASHVSMCRHCREEVGNLELLGGMMMMAGKPDSPAVAKGAPRRQVPSDLAPVSRAQPSERLPHPISATYGLSFDSIPWRRLGPGVWHHKLALSPGTAGDLRLLKISAGRAMPDHGHGGDELTLVLDGAYADQTGEYRVGDIQDVDETVEHTPLADHHTGCICLIASERPARFKGWIGRLFQPFTGM